MTSGPTQEQYRKYETVLNFGSTAKADDAAVYECQRCVLSPAKSVQDAFAKLKEKSAASTQRFMDGLKALEPQDQLQLMSGICRDAKNFWTGKVLVPNSQTDLVILLESAIGQLRAAHPELVDPIGFLFPSNSPLYTQNLRTVLKSVVHEKPTSEFKYGG